MGYSPWGLKESDTTELLNFRFQTLVNGITVLHNKETTDSSLDPSSLVKRRQTRENRGKDINNTQK